MHDAVSINTLRHEDRTDSNLSKDSSRKRAEVRIVIQDSTIDDGEILPGITPVKLTPVSLVPCHVCLEGLQMVLRRGP